jgi:predicted ATPase
MTSAGPAQTALDLPSGARFYRCALQVNPFSYIQRHNKKVTSPDEAAYNHAVVQGCKENGIEVIAIADHYRVRTAERLADAARKAGIHVFPGFEAVSKDGVHFLCIFPPDRDIASLERIIGACGIHDDSAVSPTGSCDAEELLKESKNWGAILVAAHVASQGGLLTKLSGQSRINAWTSPLLLACALPGPIIDAPDNVRQILLNKNTEHRRHLPVAMINAMDVCSPEDLARPGATSWIKMSEVSIEGLRQAFLEPASRIRLFSDPIPEKHSEFLTIAWQGGFLDGGAVHFNENLNVLIGGRGTGKSTVLESIRFALGLEPLGEEARKAHQGIINHVLRSGTKISLLVRTYSPAKREYLIERTIPNPPVVREALGSLLALTPSDVVPKAEVYGQHEIAELARSKEKLTRLLERFVEREGSLTPKKAELARSLERSRIRILDLRKESKQVAERLGSLPALEETLKSFQEAGLEERLKEQSLIVREERVLKTVSDRLLPWREVGDHVRRNLPIDRAFLSAKALENLPNGPVLMRADTILERLNRELEALSSQFAQALQRADADLRQVTIDWNQKKQAAQANYERILRELQKSKVDGEEFIRLRRQIEELRPLKESVTVLEQEEKKQEENRRNLLAEWEDIKAEEFRQLERAARKVTGKLVGRVRVQVRFGGNREPLNALLREQIGGRLSEAIDALNKRESLSLSEFVSSARAGGDTLSLKFGISLAQAERITQAPPEVLMNVEELDLAPTTDIELNVAPDEQPPVWQSLGELSTGQKATAVLLLLLLESDAPLVVDQPEDDLDNRFITEGVVPKMREEKRRRQFIFATHNANIPVLGDAELIVGLTASGEAGFGKAKIPVEHMGSIDAEPVRELVEEVLEGGKEAFEMRRLKYGF